MSLPSQVSKRRFPVVVLILAVALGLSAVGAQAAPAAQKDLGSQYVSFINSLSHIASANKASCAKMATALKSYLSSHKSLIASLESQAKHLSRAQKVAFAEKYAGKIAAAVRTFTEDVLSCSTNKQVQAALATIKKIKS